MKLIIYGINTKELIMERRNIMIVKDLEIIGKLTTDNSGTAKWGFAKKGA